MKQKFAKQEKRNKLNQKAREIIKLIKGQTWEISRVIFKPFEGKFSKDTKIVKILSEPYQGVCRVNINGVEKDAVGIQSELLKYQAKLI